MFDVGVQEMLVILVIALLVFGPSKLPELGRMIGRAMREFRKASDEFRQTVETNLHIHDIEPVLPPPATTETSPSEPAGALPSETETAPALETRVTAVVEPGEPFCAHRGARLFHTRDCAWVKRIPETERAYFKHLADARDQGFVTCPVCEPQESA